MAGFLHMMAARPLVALAPLGQAARVTATSPARPRLHRAWWVAAVSFVALIGAAGFRATPGALIDPLQEEFGWSRGTISVAVSVNLLLFGLTAPFAAALMNRFGIRRVVAIALVLVATGSGLTVFMTMSWQLVLLWGVLVGLGTGSMALAFVATVAGRWFVAQPRAGHRRPDRGQRHRPADLPAGGGLAGRVNHGWRAAALVVAGAALAVVPLVLLLLRDYPADVGLPPYGGDAAASPCPAHRRRRPHARSTRCAQAARTRPFWLLAGGFAICGATTNGLVGTHFIPAAHDHGMPETTAAGLLALVGLFDIVGTIASGWLTDRVDSRLLLGRLLRAARAVAAGPAGAVRRDRAPEHAGLHHLLRPGLGGHRAADGRALPAVLRRRPGRWSSAGSSPRTRSGRRSRPPPPA